MKVVKKVWGEEHWIVNREYCGKKLVLKKDHHCSYHMHNVKDETFYVIKGKVLLEMNDNKKILVPGNSILIPPKTFHRFTGIEDSEIIEFSTTHMESDSYRNSNSGKIDTKQIDRIIESMKKFK